jgi:hypothetical protein
MNTAIIISLVIPAIVAAVLTGMLIKERDYFFHRKESLPTEKHRERKKESRSPEDYRNQLNRIDFSGGTMGI